MRWHYIGFQRLMSAGDDDGGRLTSAGAKVPRRIRFRNLVVQRKPDTDWAIKYASLVVLVLQNASQVLLIRYTYTRQATNKEYQYLSTVSVFFTECVKLVTCLLLVAIQERGPKRYFRALYHQILCQPLDTLKVCVPSILYTIQNNLLYIAVKNLEAATFMVTYQLKILTTALCSVIMLRKPLSYQQWISLLLLFVGVSIVQWQESLQKNAPIVANATLIPNMTTAMPTTLATLLANANSSQDALKRISRQVIDEAANDANLVEGAVVNSTLRTVLSAPVSPTVSPVSHHEQNPLIGFAAVVVSCLISGFAGVYFEKILKGSDVSVWMRNIQLALIAIPIAFGTIWIKDRTAMQQRGMMAGFDWVIWLVVILYAVGGLTVAVVMKFADNILKGFATSLSIIVSCVFSVYFFNFRPTFFFCVGTGFVIIAVYIYSKFPYKTRYVPPVVNGETELDEKVDLVKAKDKDGKSGT